MFNIEEGPHRHNETDNEFRRRRSAWLQKHPEYAYNPDKSYEHEEEDVIPKGWSEEHWYTFLRKDGDRGAGEGDEEFAERAREWLTKNPVDDDDDRVVGDDTVYRPKNWPSSPGHWRRFKSEGGDIRIMGERDEDYERRIKKWLDANPDPKGRQVPFEHEDDDDDDNDSDYEGGAAAASPARAMSKRMDDLFGDVDSDSDGDGGAASPRMKRVYISDDDDDDNEGGGAAAAPSPPAQFVRSEDSDLIERETLEELKDLMDGPDEAVYNNKPPGPPVMTSTEHDWRSFLDRIEKHTLRSRVPYMLLPEEINLVENTYKGRPGEQLNNRNKLKTQNMKEYEDILDESERSLQADIGRWKNAKQHEYDAILSTALTSLHDELDAWVEKRKMTARDVLNEIVLKRREKASRPPKMIRHIGPNPAALPRPPPPPQPPTTTVSAVRPRPPPPQPPVRRVVELDSRKKSVLGGLSSKPHPLPRHLGTRPRPY